jgi:hypothetical protein
MKVQEQKQPVRLWCAAIADVAESFRRLSVAVVVAAATSFQLLIRYLFVCEQ